MQIRDLHKKDFPPLLLQINDPPKSMRIIGELPQTKKYLCVVGSRKYSDYGKAVCEKLIEGLRGYSITIVSGLALGMDGIAHRAALKTGLPTIAVPGSGLGPKALYPVTNRNIAEEIIESGGALISEFADDFRPRLESFPQRNRIMAGMSHATLIVEAELKSGTLITSKYATEYNRDVFTVPHSIFSKTSEGPHMLLRLGATPITQSSDIVTALGLRPRDELLQMRDYSGCSTDERELISLLSEPLSRDEIIRRLGKPVYATQTIIATMEIKGLIEEVMGEIHLV
ncbi:MAG: DNA protecting protein DprA [Candidatus Zambryskibacteria bacterium RIFCSPLOWO2_12_FULL_39_45]|uniref:DNA protecting protein DprA n=2 Tax=Candidatus Zambryskiibacteriota TaxID=1817925 RepID=A0A1G2UQK4_9BACT|nr:MAG: protecting protein DprA protein [Parcubacteria group bacterium GW2011_GWA2_40_14]OHA98247.1 MAG: DNA protecting protein DprA [Candidatus Zambryskibacteria bacterium RIFCSPHIGHO2_12_FULL_38_37]OHB08642.1 MAG: DNA protecting protein DprA [Candidatus Zambryskibacteria bacterium RIFCSPLOWO2_02_39_10]OHB11664.1 MAG: DNA protecting protein DprA [Candidatus Zambryskibacteria bacterium RIFCSPLOWO2_12_39_8]OHB13598.1 MAG: DNA protecting protein DprA [Candidatus Zambryskibacteria bacterium RIFCSP